MEMSNETSSYTLNIEGERGLSFDSYFEDGFQIAAEGLDGLMNFRIRASKPKDIIEN